MSLQNVPGFQGVFAGRMSSMDGRFIGKMTDSNHLESLHQTAPQAYDKKIISLYTQSSMYSNDFLNMINKSTPFYLDGMTDTWTWEIERPFEFSKIIEVPDSTLSQSNIGADGKVFEIVLDGIFGANSIISMGHLMYGQQFYVTQDPIPYGRGWLHRVTLVTDNVSEVVNKTFLSVGVEVQEVNGAVGEFDQQLAGLDKLASKLRMYESLGAEYGKQHTITGWADDKRINGKDMMGNPLDIIYYAPIRNGKIESRNDVKWEPFIEFLMRKQMLQLKVLKMIWSKAGTPRSFGARQELKKVSGGIYQKMRNSGNYVPYNRGEFSAQLIRSVFGDLFYRRVDVADRKVKLYTNEAGFNAFQQAVKEDALGSGLTLMANVDALKTGNVGVADSSQHLTYSFAFDAFVSRETGRVELHHLKELDLPQTNLEFGQNKMSTPIFFVFDVSSPDGGMVNNIREVRRADRPNMLWGYIDGRRHHLGPAKSQGMSSANMLDGYQIWMQDRCDVFIEDLSRTVVIEEIPNF